MIQLLGKDLEALALRGYNMCEALLRQANKRIQELEKEVQWYKDYIERLDELNEQDFIFREELEENYVPKERIIAKIEQFKHISATIQGYKCSDVPTDLKRNDYAVNILLELLGEKYERRRKESY